MKQILIEKYIEPSEIRTTIDGFVIECWFDINYDLHSFMGQPACVFYNNGQIIYKEWYKKDELHRCGNLPTLISYKNGKMKSQHWHRKGVELKNIYQ
jgi:hypothetical protein